MFSDIREYSSLRYCFDLNVVKNQVLWGTTAAERVYHGNLILHCES